MRRLACNAAFLAVAILLSTVGCGGGGGGGDAGPQVVLLGDYSLSFLSANVDGCPGGPSVVAVWGRGVVGTEGHFIGDIDLNDDGLLVDAVEETWFRADSDRTLHVSVPGTPRPEVGRGGVSADGGIAVSATSDDPTVALLPHVRVMLRTTGSYAVSSASGAYTLCGLAHDNVAGTTRGIVGGIASDGAGSWSGESMQNVNGVIGGPYAAAGTYAVAPDGWCMWTVLGSGSVEGALAPGGGFGAFAGMTNAGDDPGLYAILRAAGGPADDGRFVGTFFLVGIQYDVAANVFVSHSGLLTADGAGNYTATFGPHRECEHLAEAADEGTYDVLAEGVLVTRAAGGATFRGALSATGDLAILGGGATPGTNPGLYFLLRR